MTRDQMEAHLTLHGWIPQGYRYDGQVYSWVGLGCRDRGLVFYTISFAQFGVETGRVSHRADYYMDASLGQIENLRIPAEDIPAEAMTKLLDHITLEKL